METQVKFKPILLNKNEESIKQLEEHIKESAEKLNKAVEEVELILETELTDEEKTEALREGISYVTNRLKKTFQFPNATDEFNMQAIGKDISEIKPLMDQAKTLIDNVYYELKSGKFQLSRKGKKMIEEQYSEYTKNEKQNECYNIALNLSKTLNVAMEKGYYSNYEINQISRLLVIVHQEEYLGEFSPNYRNISRLREIGGFSAID